MVRSWATDRDGAIAALRKYAALDVPLDDAVEAEMLAMALSGDPLGDLVEMVNLAWTVSDAERLGEALLSEPRAVQLRFNPAAASDGQTPPPRMMFLLLDRALPSTAADLSLETVPNILAQAMLFGRQTDREARLEATGVWADKVEPLESLVAAGGGRRLGRRGRPRADPETSGQPPDVDAKLASAGRRLAGTTRIARSRASPPRPPSGVARPPLGRPGRENAQPGGRRPRDAGQAAGCGLAAGRLA